MLQTPSPTAPRPFGQMLREWRLRRRWSQLDLAGEAEISTRHLSFVETGRAQPSRQMVLHLAERLAVPLRERNALLAAAGYAPLYRERPLADPALAAARDAVDKVLEGMHPYPALAVDRHWQLVAHNRVVPMFFAGIAPELLQPPVNVLRVSLHPAGLAPRIANLAQWRGHVLHRLRRQIENSDDAGLRTLLEELQSYPAPQAGEDTGGERVPDAAGVVVPLQLSTDAGVLSLLSFTTLFGTPVDITLSELAIESFLPADADTARALRRLGDGQGSAGGA